MNLSLCHCKSFLLGALIMVSGIRTFGGNPPDEGMWLPILIERLNYVDMQKMGLHLTPEELYDVNHSSLKDAIVGLSGGGASGGFFCTAEVVSDQGLIFTNHHCGYGAVQNHSTPENDYLTNGFWAMSMKEELPNENFCASFLVRIENVTDSIIPLLSDTLKENERGNKVREISNRLKKHAEDNGKFEASVKSFFGGNEYYLFVFKTYKDVRLVGAPPSSIGKFGGDTDNWMWPRHTGDFTILRIYADSIGNPADFSENNVPLHPKYHLPISLKGVEKNDFAMIWGFPGNTSRFMTSYGIEFSLSVLYPTIIKIFGESLEIMKERMDADKKVKIAYASNYAGIANTWKNFIGQSKMLKRNKVQNKKRAIEDAFIAWYSRDPNLNQKYGEVLHNLEMGYSDMKKIAVPYFYANMGGMGLDIVQIASHFNGLKQALEKKNKGQIKETVESLKETVEEHYKEFDQAIEKNTTAALLNLYIQDVPVEFQPSIFPAIEKEFGNDFVAYSNALYSNSIFSSKERILKFLENPAFKKLVQDPGWKLMESISETAGKYSSAYQTARTKVTASNRLFIAGLLQMNPEKKYYPDANGTLRMTYGTVLDYYPADAVHYNFTTSLKGVMEKEDPDNDEFIVEKKLKELYMMKDYGQYGENGEMIVCFLTTNDITGGNSGSPVINGNGELIGIAFDGNWEAMSGDIMFEPTLQRTINVDIRYVLFIIDKFAGATNLIQELTLVK